MNIKQKLTLFLAVILAHTGMSQELKFTVNGFKDTTVHLVKYVGKGMYYADTTQSKNGVIKFDGAKHKNGVYAVFLPGQKYFDFVHDHEEIDAVVENEKDLVGSMKIKKSRTNIAFYKYIHYMTSKKILANKLNEEMKTADADRKKEITAELKGLNKDVIAFQKSIVDDFQGKFLSDIINMSLEVELPAAPTDENGVITDSNYVYNYYIHHFWDNTNLKNDALVRTPLFHKKLEQYLSSQVLLQIPDTISKYADILIEKTLDSSAIKQYIISHVTSTSEQSDRMGMENVFVHMVDTYYCPTPTTATWMTEEGLTKVCKRADEMRPSLIGSYAPRICLPDSTEKNWIDFYKIDSEYKILYFWEATCGHCKKSTPKLQKLYAEKLKARNVEVYAVGKAMGDDFAKWKQFIKDNELTFINVGLTKSVYEEAQTNAYSIIKDHNTSIESLNYTKTYDVTSTPRIFVLDKDNKIIYKRISIAQLEDILDKIQGVPEAEKLFPIEEEDPEERENATN
ncbi:hypothetical protein DNU06_06060 [Putridiphycobacter roseus]|uniref:Thioredoxin domain-containing protein n=1 Tax=Putridiphycobacter roseus TaxID=2219161 RepID=A0A2W1NJP2_9FLAO|nr:redoxin domain-containing protein [Putridiphycobacter roseus]PZE18176.1 hypothetical protein DNU06_06060 [Putridiphycobacter roseus]